MQKLVTLQELMALDRAMQAAQQAASKRAATATAAKSAGLSAGASQQGPSRRQSEAFNPSGGGGAGAVRSQDINQESPDEATSRLKPASRAMLLHDTPAAAAAQVTTIAAGPAAAAAAVFVATPQTGPAPVGTPWTVANAALPAYPAQFTPQLPFMRPGPNRKCPFAWRG